MDIFSGSTVGFYALLYMYVGFFNGYFRKLFYPEDIKLPMLLIGGSDLVYNLAIYFFLFLFRNRYEFGYYFVNIIVPELVYTMLVTIVLYMILLKINQRLELIEKRSAKKFVWKYQRIFSSIKKITPLGICACINNHLWYFIVPYVSLAGYFGWTVSERLYL